MAEGSNIKPQNLKNENSFAPTSSEVDHRKIGIDHELFFLHEYSPGSAFWLPNGTKIYGKLMSFIRDEYIKRGFQEVQTPVIAKEELWEISGHAKEYKDDMFYLEKNSDDSSQYAMKPMQCPLHCLMFKYRNRSYKELPLRLADFGSLHRNELSNTLRGLFRGKKFTQDDAHVFCTYDQIKSEMLNALDFLTFVYGKFGFEFTVGLSTRPDNFIGEIEVWDKAEKELTDVLNESELKWNIKEKDGAFYGPKIDIHLTDSLGRQHQCATIQLDFQLPSDKCFKLEYLDEKGELIRPVMIHRAIYGSFERFIAILCEHYNGKWPFWLNPKQIKVIPISEKHLDYANFVAEALRKGKCYVDVDITDNRIAKKISNAQLEFYNYMLVVGDKEANNNTVNVRYRDNDVKKLFTIDELIKELDQNVADFK